MEFLFDSETGERQLKNNLVDIEAQNGGNQAPFLKQRCSPKSAGGEVELQSQLGQHLQYKLVSREVIKIIIFCQTYLLC